VTYTEWKREKAQKASGHAGGNLPPPLPPAQKAAPAAGSGAVFNMQEHRARMEESARVIAASRAQRERERALFTGGTNLTSYDSTGRVVRDSLPAWTEYIQREREAGRLPLASVMERARAAGQPIRDAGDWKRRKHLFGGDGPGGEAA
jgi:hypothetical protein